MTAFYVAAVRDWDEDRMMSISDLDILLELGTEKAFITRDYKTVRGLLRYRLHNHFAFYSHVWAIHSMVGESTRFLGLEYNPHDDELNKLATRYMRVRKRKGHYMSRTSGIALSVRA